MDLASFSRSFRALRLRIMVSRQWTLMKDNGLLMNDVEVLMIECDGLVDGGGGSCN